MDNIIIKMLHLVAASWLNILRLEYELILPDIGKLNYTIANDWSQLEFFNDELLLDCHWPAPNTRLVFFPELECLPDDIEASATESYGKDVLTYFARRFTQGKQRDAFNWFLLDGQCSTAKSLPVPPRYCFC